MPARRVRIAVRSPRARRVRRALARARRVGLTLARAAALAACLACRPPPPDLPPSPPPTALERLADRCDRGEAPTCLELAASIRDAGDPRRALAYVTRACELASPRACAELADALATGDLVAPNQPRALELRVQACLGGFAPACRAAALALPPAEAAAFRQRACAAGDTDLCPPPPAPPPAQVDPRDEAAVVLALAGRRGAIRGCYEAVLVDHPRLRGPVTLEIAVGPDGVPRAAAVVDGLDPVLDPCVATVAMTTMFAPTSSGELVIVRWRTVFEPRE